MSGQDVLNKYDFLTLVQEQTESLIGMLWTAMSAGSTISDLRGAVSVIAEKHDESMHATNALFEAIQKSGGQSDAPVDDLNDGMIYDSLETVSSYANMGRTAIYAAIKNDGFPEPYQLGKRQARWKRTEVLAWLESRPRGTRPTPVDKSRRARADMKEIQS